MKKAIPMLLALLLVGLLSGCMANIGQQPSTQVKNPVHDSSAKEILDTLGMNMNVPDDAQNISYATIDTDNDKPIAQAKFTLDNVEYTYRIRSAASFEDISGAYFDWKTTNKIEISYCSGEVRFIDGEQGICLWYDTVPGLMYCIYAESGASEDSLLAMANKLYIPAKDAG